MISLEELLNIFGRGGWTVTHSYAPDKNLDELLRIWRWTVAASRDGRTFRSVSWSLVVALFDILVQIEESELNG